MRGVIEMTKDEMKNKISMALKESVLQQGFEIICKNLAELEKENAEFHCQMNRNKFCYSCINATDKCFRNEIGCPCEKYKSYKDEITERKAQIKLLTEKVGFWEEQTKLKKAQIEEYDRLNMFDVARTDELREKAQKQLTKAKEIIKKFSEFVNNEVEFDPEHPQEHTNLWNELCEKAEQFLKEVEDEKDNLCFKLE